MKIDKAVLIILLGFNALFISVAFATEPSPIHYGDCAYIEFEDVDPSELTLQERIDLLNADLFASLDKSEKCMQKAAVTGAGKIAVLGAANDSVNSSVNASNAGNAGNVSEVVDEKSQTKTSSPSSATSSVTDNKPVAETGGSSAVCDAVKQGLAAATTDSEKEHFKGLKNQYACQ